MLLAGLLVALAPQSFARADDWCSTGLDCALFAAGDVDGDGFADVVTLNGSHQICFAASVHGWKAAGWEVLREGVADGAVALEVGDFLPSEPGTEVAVRYADHAVVFARRQAGRFADEHPFAAPPAATVGPASALEPPPYEPDAPVLCHARGDIDGDGRDDKLTVFTASRPHPHRVVRVGVALRTHPGDERTGKDSVTHDGTTRDGVAESRAPDHTADASATTDIDGDGLSDARERELGSDPTDRDTDDDGLLDGWEVNGLPRGVAAGDGALSPVHRDVILVVSRYEQLDEAAVRAQVEKSKRLFAAMPIANPDGTHGIAVHVRFTAPVPAAMQGNWRDVGARMLRDDERGLVHWMQVTPGGGGQAQQTGDMGSSGAHWAAFAHEVGHQLSLSHTGDSEPGWCPLYPSLMNYAFNYQLGGDGNAIRFSNGRFAGVELRETALVERLPFPLAELRYLQAPPYRFTLEADGDQATRIDWDHNGRFDEGPVVADVNYGGSTYCGIRHNVEICGAAPALCVVGGVVQLVTVDPRCSAVSVRACEGDGKWSAPRAVSASATRDDPVAVSAGDAGFVLFRSQRAWHIVRFTADAIEAPVELGALGSRDASAVFCNDKVLIVSRDDDDRLAAWWYDWHGKHLGEPQALPVRSHVPPGLALEPAVPTAGGAANPRLVLAASHVKPGHDWCLSITWLTRDGTSLEAGETLWTRGAAVNHCTTRPVVAFRGTELNVFHTGWFDGNGLTTAWRTRRVGNRALDDGWLTCLLYDQWTLTRVGVAFAEGPQGTVYAYRWDPGDHGDMKVNMVQTAHNGWGIEAAPMRDFDDCDKIARWGIRHSILYMRRTGGS
ncbi:MAG: hypothetical protein R3F56_01360 [Planctomycetota bacterium]